MACVSYSAIGADYCIYGACPFWSHVTLRCEYNLYTENELAMIMAPERKKKMTDKEPKLDYWMVGILEESVKTEIKRASAGYPVLYVSIARKKRNKFDVLGQLQLIMDRLNEIKTHYDDEIGDGLDRGKTK